MYVIGIDPGKDTGVAVFCTERKKLIAVDSTDFWGAIKFVQEYDFSIIAEIIIEVPNSKHVWHKGAANARALQRQGANVGSVVREAELLAAGFERFGYNVKRVQPRKKYDAETFAAWTGWDRQTNQHGRDAAMMCFGRSHA